MYRSITKVLKEQNARFGIFSLNARKFITSNFLFGLFNPFYIIFSNTFIFSSTKGDIEMNLVYCIFTFAGIICGFVVNGYASRRIYTKQLLIAGVWLIFITVVIMFSLHGAISLTHIVLFGLFTGIGSGIYWSSRNYLTFVLTDETCHDFISGIDYILGSAGRIITPFLIGMYIGYGVKMDWFSAAFAYQSTLILAFILTLLITVTTFRVNHEPVYFNKFLYWRYSDQWQKVRYLFLILGFFQAAIVVIPTVFVMKFVGGESAVGTINSAGYMLAIVLVYMISSRSGIKHRTKIIKLGFILLLIGTTLFTIFLGHKPGLGTYILVFLMFLTEPMLNFPVRATLLKAIDTARKHEMREEFAYIFDVEAFTAIGRIASLIMFYLLYQFMPVNFSLGIYIMLIAVIQYLCIPLSRKINGC